jgi:hypothetical protein
MQATGVLSSRTTNARLYMLSLSFANLVYLRAWTDLLPLSSDFLFNRKRLPGISLYFGIALDVFALSLLTFLLIRVAPKLPGWLQRALPIVAIAMVALVPFSFMRRGLFGSLPPKILFPLAALLCVFAIGLAFRFSSLTLRLVRIAALAATPCLAVTFVEPLFYLHAQQPLPPDPPLARRLPGSPPVRVLWVIFDEWDQRLTFTNRAPGTLLPVLDRLTTRSFTATRALAVLSGTVPVYDMASAQAIPSLLYGKLVAHSGIEDAETYRLQFADRAVTTLGAGDSIFSRMRAQGGNSAVAGWYLPYCRVFNPLLTDCYWDEMYQQRASADPALPAAALDETRMLFETGMFSPFGPSLVMDRHFNEYEALLAAATRYAADPSIGLAFIHFNVPHAPYFYTAKTGPFYSTAHYNDALQWVDRAVGGILSAIGKAGLESKTAIILSSDHPERFSQTDPYVPFIVHLPGQTGGVASDEEFSTMKTADLALAIARGEVKSTSDVENSLGISRLHR